MKALFLGEPGATYEGHADSAEREDAPHPCRLQSVGPECHVACSVTLESHLVPADRMSGIWDIGDPVVVNREGKNGHDNTPDFPHFLKNPEVLSDLFSCRRPAPGHAAD